MPAVPVLYFASIRDRLACERESVELPSATTAAEVLRLLAARHPRAADLIATCRLAVDQQFAVGAIALTAGCELAVIPPVSGG